ncbi:MAG: porin family protein, partial [Saprospiraceae bacterium]
LLCSGLPALQAQMSDEGVRLGLKLGVTGSRFYDDNQAWDRGKHTGIVGGGFAKIPLSEHFSLRPELLFASRGGDYNYANRGKTKLKLNYLELPLSLEYNLFGILNIHGGFHLGMLVSESGTFRDNQGNLINFELSRDDFNRLNYGWHLGGGLDLGNLGIHLRYLHGLQEISKSENFNQYAGKLKNAAWELSVSYALK